MESYLLKGFIIGIIFGMPIGAVGVLTVQRTLTYGPWVGLASGMGSSVADCLYACVGTFGLTYISDFLFDYQTTINIIGASLFLYMGIRLVTKKNEVKIAQPQMTDVVKVFLSSFIVGITNPAVIMTFLFAFSYFGIIGKIGMEEGIQLIIGILIGTAFWWITLVVIVGLLKKKTSVNSYKNMNKLFGILMLLFSIIVFIRICQNGRN